MIQIKIINFLLYVEQTKKSIEISDFVMNFFLELQAELKKSNRLVDDNNNTSTILKTRLERLLKERELRKSLKSCNDQDVIVNSIVDDQNQIITPLKDNFPTEEELVKGLKVSKLINNESERQDRSPFKQRLLVVANRLPVSAVRKGDASWHLEVTVGGLVSALLGKFSIFFLIFSLGYA